MKTYASFRWILLGTGLLAIVGLTGMNAYSLLKLHQTAIHASEENKRHQLRELASTVRNRFFEVPKKIWKMNSPTLDECFASHRSVPGRFNHLLAKVSEDSLYSGIYFEFNYKNPVHPSSQFTFNKETGKLEPVDGFPQVVNDGIGLAKTRMKVFVNDYQYPTRTLFDASRSMTVTIFNTNDHTIIGYLCLPINNDYLLHHFLQPLLEETFNPKKQPGITVWVHNWVKNEALVSSNPKTIYNRKNVQMIVAFPGMFDNWDLQASYSNEPIIEASGSELHKNLVVLCAGALLLLGSMIFIFITAQKERDLAHRQAGFLANVTHELKTPISVMLAAGENLSDGRVRDPGRIRTYGKHIYNEANRLRCMIDKLLDVARADAGQLPVRPSIVQLGDLLHRYLDQHLPYLTSDGFTVNIDIEPQIPPVKVDVSSFETIIGNLIENAVKYSENERYLALRLYHQKNEIRLDVADHGIGIPPNAQKHIFDKFFRVESSLTAHTRGHGLGLSIVQYLVERNGGYITLHSQLEQGSIFTLHFPIIDQPADVARTTGDNAPFETEAPKPYAL